MKTTYKVTYELLIAVSLLAFLLTGVVMAGGQGPAVPPAGQSETPDGTAPFDPSTARLPDYLTLAARENPALQAAFYEWKAAVEKAGYAGVLPDPTFSYTYFLESVETRVGPQNQIFRIQQAFPWFGTLGTKKDAALDGARAALQRFESKKFELFYKVKSAYYDYYYLGREIDVTAENLELLKFWESVARAGYRAAAARQTDVVKAQVEIGVLEDRLFSLEQQVNPAAARLRAVLNLPGEVSLPVPAEIDVSEQEANKDEILSMALAGNPGLKNLGFLIDQARAGNRLAGKMSRPSFFIGLDYVDIGEAANPLMPESGKNAVTATVGMSVPLWFGANRAKRNEADAHYRKAQNDLADARNQLAAAVDDLVFAHDDALRKTRLYRDGLLPRAEQSAELHFAAYRAGEVGILELLDAQRQLLDLQLRYERARTDLALTQAEIQKITGKEISHEHD